MLLGRLSSGISTVMPTSRLALAAQQSLSPSSLPNSFLFCSAFHTCTTLDSRIKYRHTHKPFWHIKKTAKGGSDPLTPANRDFLQEMKDKMYRENKIGAVSIASPLHESLAPWPRGEWRPDAHNTRTGVIARKIGQQVMWLKNGKRVQTTLLQVEDNHVVKYLTAEEYARTVVGEKLRRPRLYGATRDFTRGCLVVGSLSGDPEKLTKDYCGLFTEAGIAPKKLLTRFPVTDNAILQPGTPLNASHFQPGQFIDVRGRSTRRGFQGVMKRHGFHGMPRESGVRKSHRRPGCIGSGRAKHRVWPKQKLPGHMGGDMTKMSGMEILRINYAENVLYVKGQAVPGESGEAIFVTDSQIPSKRFSQAPRYFPTSTPEEHEGLPEEEYAEHVHRFEDPTITFEAEEAAKK